MVPNIAMAKILSVCTIMFGAGEGYLIVVCEDDRVWRNHFPVFGDWVEI